MLALYRHEEAQGAGQGWKTTRYGSKERAVLCEGEPLNVEPEVKAMLNVEC